MSNLIENNMAYKLERVQVAGFKSIRELDIELRDLNVLIGANGSGKSNFIEVFRLLNMILQRRLQLYSQTAGVDALLHYGQKVTSSIGMNFIFRGTETNFRYDYKIILSTSDEDTLLIKREKFSGVNLPSQTATWGEVSPKFANKETSLYEINEFSDNGDSIEQLISAMNAWKVYHFHDTSRTAAMKSSHELHDNAYLKPDAANLAVFLYVLRERYARHYKRIVQTIRRIAPFFDDFVLEPETLNQELMRLRWRDVNYADSIFTAHTLSDGTLRFICLVTLLMQPDELMPSLILIDEPELGLHPFATTLLAELLESASHKTQVIVSTQSVPLVNQFAPEHIIVVDRKDGQSTFEHLDTDKLEGWLEDYGLGDLWEKNVLGGLPQREIPVP